VRDCGPCPDDVEVLQHDVGPVIVDDDHQSVEAQEPAAGKRARPDWLGRPTRTASELQTSATQGRASATNPASLVRVFIRVSSVLEGVEQIQQKRDA
jgi:hypothetical protein